MLTGSESEEENSGLLLLADLRQYFQAMRTDKVASKDVAEWLKLQEERPWAVYGKGQKPITPTQMAWLLKPFGIRTRQLSRPVNAKGYELADCRDSFVRYLPPDPAAQNEATKQASTDATKPDCQSEADEAAASDRNTGFAASNQASFVASFLHPSAGGEEGEFSFDPDDPIPF